MHLPTTCPSLTHTPLTPLQNFPPDFRGWVEMVPGFTYNKQLPFFQMLVPTMDTVR